MRREEKEALESHVHALLAEAGEKKDLREVERELRELIEPRKLGQGRTLFVPKATSRSLEASAESFLSLRGIMDYKRKAKLRRYRDRLSDRSYAGPKILAEGDSWLEYPCVKDNGEWLGDKYALLSLALAGDTWAGIISQEGGRYDDGTPMGLFENIRIEKPHIVLLSIGGNEIMGDMEKFVEPFADGRTAAQYINADFKQMLDLVDRTYQRITKDIVQMGCKVILHSYDYPDPRPQSENGQWIGPPLEFLRNIAFVTLWREIPNLMLRRFAARLQAIADNSNGNVHFVNLLGTIGTNDHNTGPDRMLWNDEIHGSAEGFRRISKKLSEKIDHVWSQMLTV